MERTESKGESSKRLLEFTQYITEVFAHLETGLPAENYQKLVELKEAYEASLAAKEENNIRNLAALAQLSGWVDHFTVQYQNLDWKGLKKYLDLNYDILVEIIRLEMMINQAERVRQG